MTEITSHVTRQGPSPDSDGRPAPLLQPPSPFDLRAQLEGAVVGDLCGPAGGQEEEVDEDRVRERYLVGLLAPRHQHVPREESDDIAVSSDGSSEDGRSDVGSLQANTLFPSSFGVSVCVGEDVEALQVTTRWGRYRRKPSEHLTEPRTGKPKLVWKRTPVEATLSPLVLREGLLDPIRLVEDEPEVTVQGEVRRFGNGWIVTLFLVNGHEARNQRQDEVWLFQPELIVEAPDGRPVFCRRMDRRMFAEADPFARAERETMEMLYRHQVEFAVGHGVAVHAETHSEDPHRAYRVSTAVIPTYEVPQQTPPGVEEIPELAGLVLDMQALAELSGAGLARNFSILTEAYAGWIRRQREMVAMGAEGLEDHRRPAEEALARCEATLNRIRAGVELLVADDRAAAAFRFANRAMALQRTRSIFAREKRRGRDPVMEEVDVPRNRTWYPFQLAFILLNLPGVTDLNHPDRSSDSQAVADLLWFPTGGGKTEAYLGLTAYTLALRRLQGTTEGRTGEHGVAVLMRYTLRLLTLQQFQRATTLICAAESLRREAVENGDLRWGREPFRLGLWVGRRTTPNTTEQSAEAIQSDRGQFRNSATAGTGSPEQLTSCPWCGSAIDPGRHIKVDKVAGGRGRTNIYCGDPLGRCLFTEKQAPGEGIPALVVDEEVYRRPPTLLIATVDKFAQMPWNGATQTLFGQVEGFCPRHGFRSPEIEDADTHPRRGLLPAVKSTPHAPLRPPDLIIQDELHLISGPLGTLVGLYETAVDQLSTWTVGGKKVRPKVIASTATIRRAPQQVHALFMRQVEVFPPQGTDIRDNFFSVQREPGEKYSGRRYMGICASGKRYPVTLIRVYVAYLAAAQQLYLKYGHAMDPWMTLVGYFNSMREVGGTRRLVEDDVRSRLRDMDQRGLAKRRPPILRELTSRIGATDIPKILDLLEVEFDPADDEERRAQRAAHRPVTLPEPLDVLLATNMIAVGVDVNRLGLMVVAGQPKTTSEYIQATSRVGRRWPGLVCTVYNWARPRDLSHYERFEHYHATFYQHVEPLSVTPFAPRALDRGLSAVLVALVRLAATIFNENSRAQAVERDHQLINRAVEAIASRAAAVSGEKAVEDRVRKMLQSRVDHWLKQAQSPPTGTKLGYKQKKDGVTLGLLREPALGGWDRFTCLNSLRDVEPTVNLVLADPTGLDDDGPVLNATAATAGEPA